MIFACGMILPIATEQLRLGQVTFAELVAALQQAAARPVRWGFLGAPYAVVGVFALRGARRGLTLVAFLSLLVAQALGAWMIRAAPDNFLITGVQFALMIPLAILMIRTKGDGSRHQRPI